MAAPSWKLVQQASEARAEGRPEQALALYREAEQASGGDAESRAHCLRHIGDLALELERKAEAREALIEAERLYRTEVPSTLSLANTLRLRALADGEAGQWAEARKLYAQAQRDGGYDLRAALAECDRHLQQG